MMKGDDGLDAARGILLAVAFGIAFWVIVGIVIARGFF
jgi:hypothetical protein